MWDMEIRSLQYSSYDVERTEGGMWEAERAEEGSGDRCGVVGLGGWGEGKCGGITNFFV